MDTEDCGYEDLRDCLRDLASVNRVTLGYRPTLGFLARMTREGRMPIGRLVHIVDVGSGYGDTLRAIHRWANRRGIEVQLTGIDLNPWSIRAAREASLDYPKITWIERDMFELDEVLGDRPDIIVSALFTHHLDGDGPLRFVRWMEDTARCGWFVNDLLRHPVSYWGFAALARLFRWHRFVQHDGPLSIARAFRRSDWHSIVAATEILESKARLESWFPFRLCVSRVKTDVIPN